MSLTPAAASAARSPSVTVDRVGDGQSAPDICQIAISNDVSTVSFRITFADRPRLKAGERITLVLDTDHSDATGNPYLTGADILLSYGTTGRKTFAGELTRWKASRWAPVAGAATKASFLPGESVLRIVLDRSQLRGRSFDWFAFTFAAGTRRGSDSVPDETASVYSLRSDSGAPPGRPAKCGTASRQA